jgi:Flp pilus assembly pilin Flp
MVACGALERSPRVMWSFAGSGVGGTWEGGATSVFYFISREVAMIRGFFAREEGQGLVEYALILVLIAVFVYSTLITSILFMAVV